MTTVASEWFRSFSLFKNKNKNKTKIKEEYKNIYSNKQINNYCLLYLIITAFIIIEASLYKFFSSPSKSSKTPAFLTFATSLS